MVTFVGLTGGTGAGKSSTCTRIMNAYPDTVGMIQLDDYFRPESEVPRLQGFANWDRPEALYFDKLYADLVTLKKGEAVVINTKNERLNPNYARTDKRIPVRFEPKPVMLVEGFLVLWDERIRNLLELSIYLEIPHDIRYARRVHFKNFEYERLVLLPMQTEFAEPTKQFATHVLNVSTMTADEVYSCVKSLLKPYLS